MSEHRVPSDSEDDNEKGLPFMVVPTPTGDKEMRSPFPADSAPDVEDEEEVKDRESASRRYAWLTLTDRGLSIGLGAALLAVAAVGSPPAFVIGLAIASLATTVVENMHYAQREVAKYEKVKSLSTDLEYWAELSKALEKGVDETQKGAIRGALKDNDVSGGQKVLTYPNAIKIRERWNEYKGKYRPFEFRRDFLLLPQIFIGLIYKPLDPEAKVDSSNNNLTEKELDKIIRVRLIKDYWRHRWSLFVSTITDFASFVYGFVAQGVKSLLINAVAVLGVSKAVVGKQKGLVSTSEPNKSHVFNIVQLEAAIAVHQQEVANQLSKIAGQDVDLSAISVDKVRTIYERCVSTPLQNSEDKLELQAKKSVFKLIAEVLKFWFVGGNSNLGEIKVNNKSVEAIIKEHDRPREKVRLVQDHDRAGESVIPDSQGRLVSKVRHQQQEGRTP